ncbi:TauD/TfdA-like domain [Phytophthora cactorum]|nr:TauD/TfdA-like domain [Phytophthora cactorum]
MAAWSDSKCTRRKNTENRGLKADPTFKNLLKDATVTHLAPKIGTELSGIQLHELTNAQRDELALLIAHRGVVFFRDQEINIEQQLELGRYYGPLHVHQNLGHPKDHHEALVVENSVETSDGFLKRQMYDPFNAWHSDVSNERQPPSYTSFKVLTNPPVGGDTLWASAYEAYDRLTPPMREFISGLTAIHTGIVRALYQ